MADESDSGHMEGKEFQSYKLFEPPKYGLPRISSDYFRKESFHYPRTRVPMDYATVSERYAVKILPRSYRRAA
jgi:hypothetical protein